MRFGVLGRAFLFLTGLAAAQWPDRGGYRYLDSDTAAGPAFRWLDISGSGVRLDLSDDDNQGPFALGFRFRFYGREYDSVRVCSNGWLSFTSSSHQFHHYPIPLPDDPNALVAPLWLDLDPAQGGAVYYWVDTVQSRFVVSWENVAMHDTTDSCTFQVILDTSGTILFQYLRLPWEMRVGGYPSTAGIEDDSGLVGSQYLYDGQPSGHLLHDSLAIRFFQFDHDVSAEAILRPYCPELAEDSVVPLVRVWNAGLTAESFPVTLEIGPRYRQTLSVVGLGSLLDTVLRFPVWVPAEETCRVLAWTGLAGDEFPLSDSVLGTAVGSYQGQLRFDDGHADTWFIRVGAPNADWAAAVRFRSPYPSCRLRGALAW
ncbi:hypothetical protein FJY71_06025, partial [candidate division WOR-3 bacterium]|nr:hypothetical protein [candidate division WOR-3 bacterium]